MMEAKLSKILGSTWGYHQKLINSAKSMCAKMHLLKGGTKICISEWLPCDVFDACNDNLVSNECVFELKHNEQHRMLKLYRQNVKFREA